MGGCGYGWLREATAPTNSFIFQRIERYQQRCEEKLSLALPNPPSLRGEAQAYTGQKNARMMQAWPSVEITGRERETIISILCTNISVIPTHMFPSPPCALCGTPAWGITPGCSYHSWVPWHPAFCAFRHWASRTRAVSLLTGGLVPQLALYLLKRNPPPNKVYSHLVGADGGGPKP